MDDPCPAGHQCCPGGVLHTAPIDRGTLVTFGDVLFATDKAELKSNGLMKNQSEYKPNSMFGGSPQT